MERRISTAGFFLFKLVLPFSIFVRSYSSLPTLQGRAAVREYRHDKNTAYSGSLDARRNNQQQIGLTIIQTICCHDYLLSKTIYRQNNLSIKLSIDSSTYRFVELSNCRKNNCYVIKGRAGTSSHYRNNTDGSPLVFSLVFSLFPYFSSFLAAVLPEGFTFCTR